MKRRTGALRRSRSTHKPRPNDFYATPTSAVLPLLPYLAGIRTFAEPCAGETPPSIADFINEHTRLSRAR
jgi:hypothetical protein